MKRNNIFMWAYITVMFISCVVRAFSDFTMWSPIVVSITISSIFFAIEDLLSSVSGMYNNLYEIHGGVVKEARRKLEQDISITVRMKEKYDQYKNQIPNLKDYSSAIEKISGYNDEISHIICDIENDCKHYRKLHNVYRIFSGLLAYLGFFFLFGIMIFMSFHPVSAKVQEISTVISFGLILATQQVNLIAADHIKEDEKESAHVLEAYEEAVEGTREMEEKFSKMINLIELREGIDIGEYTYAD